MPRKKYLLKTPSRWRHISSQSSRSSGASSKVKKHAKTQYQSNLIQSLRGIKSHNYKIPEAKLKNAIEKLETSLRTATKAKLVGCHLQPGTSGLRNCGFKRDSFRRLLSECRECVLNQDWTNLAAILAIAKPLSGNDHLLYMPYFLKYAAISLLYSGEEESLNNFLYGVIGCVTDHDKKVFLNSLTSFVFEEINESARKRTGGVAEKDDINRDIGNDNNEFDDSHDDDD